MPVNDELGKRMKEFYEQVPKTRLVRRMPVAIRIDGKAFHTFTRGFQKPFDEVLIKSMQETMLYLCKNIQGCVFGYTQSDEITLILIDYQKLESCAWFDYEVQKMCSIAASMATMKFNQVFNHYVDHDWFDQHYNLMGNGIAQYHDRLAKAVDNGAMFDARCFNIPKEEVCNLIYWRQLDATRNSIQMVGQANFSHNELHGKSCNMIQDMLMTEKGINWNDFPTHQKRGSACRRVESEVNIVGTIDTISTWEVDLEMPILKGEDRDYVDKLVYVGER